MLCTSFFIIFLALNSVKVHSLSIDGPVLTKYEPCGLGVIHFDRLSENVWQGVLNLGLYGHLVEVEIRIQFEKQVNITGASQKSSLSMSDNWHGFVLKPIGKIPKQYTFYLTVEGLSKNETDVPTVTQFSLNNVPLCNNAIKASQTVDSLNLSDENDKYRMHVCGRRSLDITELISMRTEAKAGDWPWHAAIFIRDPVTEKTSYYCGGNIISSTAVVTAGHCVHKKGVQITPDRITVVAGISNHKETNQVGRQSLQATEVIVHPSYTKLLATADLAIIKVNSFKYTAYVQPICVWGPAYDKDSLVGAQATVVGFGHDNDDNPSDVLKSAYIVVQNDTTCLDYSPDVYTSLLNEFTFCAGYGPVSGTAPRNGDSGGGLVLPVMQADHKVSWFLRGVLSKCGVAPGQTACDPSYYVVYTDVGPHYGWIYNHSGLRFKNNIV